MQWKKIWVKAAIWFITEIILNLLGFDNLADYSEFLFEKEIAIATSLPQIVVRVPPHRPWFNHTLPYRFPLALKV